MIVQDTIETSVNAIAQIIWTAVSMASQLEETYTYTMVRDSLL